MQNMIKGYVESQVNAGVMDKDILDAIDGIKKYKLAVLKPVEYDNAGYRAKLDFRKNIAQAAV